MPSGRDLAHQVLRRVRRDQAFANLALSSALAGSSGLPDAERGLATELVYGVLRQRRLLDHVLQLHSHRPLNQVNADVLDQLRLAAYQLLMLDRIPAYAAVDHAVGAVRRAKGPKVAGFVNAVLRKLDPGDLRRGLPEDPLRRLALLGSLPEDLCRQWTGQLGLAETEQLARRLLEPAPLTARVNALRASAGRLAEVIAKEGGIVTPCRWSPLAVRIEGLPAPFSTPSYRQGLWTAQDEAAQLVTDLLDPQPGELAVDCCSGLGGKATHMAAAMKDRGRVICLDVNQAKLQLLQQHCRRLGLSICRPLRASAAEEGGGPLERGVVDRVLVDAPCSGLGVLRRHPELKWSNRDAKALDRLVGLQRALLEEAAALLRPGGVLVYSVCTTTEVEGPAQAEWLCARKPGLVLDGEHEGAVLPDGLPPGMLRLWPHRHGTDGFFIARFRRV